MPGREAEWYIVTGYRVELTQRARKWDEAEHVLCTCVAWFRKQTAAALSMKPTDLNDFERNAILNLAVSLQLRGDNQRLLGQPECIESYEESYRLSLTVNSGYGARIAAFNLGNAYKDLPAIRNLTEAERWYHRNLELCADGDYLARARSVGQLGLVAHLRFGEARAAGHSEREVLGHLNKATEISWEALKLLPINAISALATAHAVLGNILDDGGRVDEALRHYSEAIRYEVMQDNLYGAAVSRQNLANALGSAGRFADAREYAVAALRNFETYGDRAVKEMQTTLQLIARIELDLKAKSEGT